GGQIQGNTAMHTIQPGNFGLSQTDLVSMDPLRIGANSVVMGYFGGFPHSNDNTVGDGLNFVGYRFRGATPTSNNWYIARLDYKMTASGNHSIFARGAM